MLSLLEMTLQNRMFRFVYVLTVGVVFFLCTHSFTYAQFFPYEQQGEIALTVGPQYPSTEAVVSITLESYQLDLTGATIRWYIDGTENTAFQNERMIQVQTGDAGSAIRVGADVTLRDGSVKSLSTTIRPADIDIVIESNTHTPPFYRGRALPNVDSTVRAIAIPHIYRNGSRVPASELVFQWIVNGNVMFGGPITGKNVAEFTIDVGGIAEIEVAVSTKDGVGTASAYESVQAAEPMVMFYENNPLYGLLDVFPGRFSTTNKEITVQAEPYFVTERAAQGISANIGWAINGVPATNPSSNPLSLTLKKNIEEGSVTVDFTLEGIGGSLEAALGAFVVQFMSGNTR